MGLNVKLSEMVHYRGKPTDANYYKPVSPSVKADEGERRLEVTETYNKFIKTFSENMRGGMEDGLTPVMPYSVRHLVKAQHSDLVAKKGYPDGQSVRVRNFHSATTGFAFSLVARIIRVVLRTVFFWLSMAVAAYQQSCYGPEMEDGKKYNIVLEDLKSIGREWIDLGVTLLTPFIGLINSLSPQAISMNGLRDYYIDRRDHSVTHHHTFKEARGRYIEKQTKIHEAWVKAQSAGHVVPAGE